VGVLLAAPLFFTGNAVVVAIHFDAWAAGQEVFGLTTRGHLIAMFSAIALE